MTWFVLNQSVINYIQNIEDDCIIKYYKTEIFAKKRFQAFSF